MDYEKIIMNIKILKIMKASGYKDTEIAKYIGVTTKELLDAVANDDYIRGIWDKAQEELVSEIEAKFLTNVMAQLEDGDNGDAKWVLERLNKKYQKKETVEMTVKSIDDIINES